MATAARPSWARYRVVGWLVAAAALAYLVRNGVGVIESTVREELGLTAKQSGWFQGAFFWSYAVFQIPGGWLGQTWGARKTFALMALVWSLGAAVLGLAPALWALILAQLLIGVAQAGLMPCAALTISQWVPLRRRSVSCGAVGMGLQIGAILAGSLTGFLLADDKLNLSWRTIYLLYAIPGAVWAAWFFTRFKDRPERDPAVNEAELALIREGGAAPAGHVGPVPWRGLLTNPTMLYLCGQQICRSAGYGFFATWFPSFLQTTRGVSKEDSGYMQSFVLAGALFGALLGGVFSDWMLKKTGSLRLSRQGVGVGLHVLCAGLIVGAFYADHMAVTVAMLSMAVFCTFAGGTGALAVSIDIAGAHGAQVYAVQNMMGCFAAALSPVLVGAMFDASKDWDLVLLVFAGIYFAAALFWAMVDPTRRIEPRAVPA